MKSHNSRVVHSSTMRHVGLDVHKDTIAIAQAIGAGELQVVGTVPNGWMALDRELKRLGPPELLRCADEAGHTG